MKCQDIFNSDLEELLSVDLDDIFTSVIHACPEFVNQLSVLCFSKSLEEVLAGENNKFEKQRLFAIINISAFTRNQKINIFQKLLGNFCKKKNTSKQCLQLLQRLGISLVPMSLRADEDRLGSNFLKDVKDRKQDIEKWARVRENLELMAYKEAKLKEVEKLKRFDVKFFEDEICEEIMDIETKQIDDNVDELKAQDLASKVGSATEALNKHLDDRPKLQDVTYDNLDVGVQCNDYLAGSSIDKSLHWTASTIVEDVVDGIEIDDKVKQTKILEVPFEERVALTSQEREHILSDYTEFVKNIIVENWPEVLPDMKSVKKIPHQYSKEFSAGVKTWTGPLVFETESTLEGLSKVITNIVDQVCPARRRADGS